MARKSLAQNKSRKKTRFEFSAIELAIIVLALAFILTHLPSTGLFTADIGIQTGVSSVPDVASAISDANNNPVEASIEFRNNENGETTVIETGQGFQTSSAADIPPGTYQITIEPRDYPVKRIKIHDANMVQGQSEIIRLDDAPEQGNFTEVYAIDPTQLEFSTAEVTVAAKGNFLYKCKDWLFGERVCNGEWVKIREIYPGEDYTFTLTPEDPAFGEVADSVAESNTTSLTYVNKTVLTLNVTNTSTFLILASAELRSDSTAQSILVSMSVDGADSANASYRPDASDSYETWITHKVINLTTGLHYAAIQFATTGSTTYIKNARITAISLNESFSNETLASRAMTVGTTFGNVETLTFTPSSAGEYLIIATAETGPFGGNNHLAHVNSTMNGATLDLVTQQAQGAAMQKWFGSHTTANLSAAPVTVAINARANTGDSANIQRTRISAIRLTGSADQIFKNESAATVNTSSLTPIDLVTFAFNVTEIADFLFIATSDIANAQAIASDNVEARLRIDGVDYGISSYEPVGSSDFVTFATTQNISLSPGSHNASVAMNSISGGIVFTRNVHFSAFSVRPFTTQIPVITFVSPTDANNSIIGRSWTYINTTVASNTVITSCTLEFDSVNETATIIGTGESVTCFNNKTSTEGTHTYRIYAVAGGTATGVSETRVITMSFGAPNITYVSPTPANNSFVNTNYVFTNVTAVDPDNVDTCTQQFDGAISTMTKVGTGTTVSCNKNNTGLAEGPHNFTVTVNDSIGNTGSAGTRLVTVDTAGPQVQFTSPTETSGAFISRNYIQVNVTATDANLANITIGLFNSSGTINTTTTATSPNFANITGLAGGLYTFNATAADLAGNTNSTETRNVTIDAINPSIAFASLTEASGIFISRNYIQVNVTATDTNFANITTRLFNSTGLVRTITNATTTASNNFTSLADGTYFFNATATDLAGNTNSTETRNVTIDTIKPAITFAGPTPANDSIQGSTSATINVTVSDDTDTDVCVLQFDSVNETMTKTGSGTSVVCTTTKLGLANGLHNFTVYANDTAGNINTSVARYFTVDVGIPVVTYASPTPANSSFSAQNFIFVNITASSASSDIDTCILNFDGANSTMIKVGSGTTVSCNKNNTGLADGLHNFTVFANNTVGTYAAEGTRFVTLDTTRPAIAFVSLTETSGSIIVRNFILANVTAADANLQNITTRLFGSAGLVNSSNTTTSPNFANFTGLPDGQYFFNATAFDLAGNSNSTETRNVIVDTSTPSITNLTTNRTLPLFNNKTGENLTINFTSSEYPIDATFNLYNDTDNSTVITRGPIRVNASSELPLNFTIPANLSDGNYTLNMTANDIANNSVTVKVGSFQVGVDADSDDLPDAGDPILFNDDDVNASGVSDLNITIDGNITDIDGFSEFDIHTLTIFDRTTLMLNLTHNFSANIIDLSKVSIEKADNSIVINMSGQLAPGETKSLFAEDNDFVELCVKDSEISAVTAISSNCTGTNETIFNSCLGNASAVTINNITCTDSGTLIEISGLRFSGIRGTPAPPVVLPPTSPGGLEQGAPRATPTPPAPRIINYIGNFDKAGEFFFAPTTGNETWIFTYKGTNHTLEVFVVAVASQFALVEIDGRPDQIRVDINETELLDVDGDGKLDFELELNSIVQRRANMRMALLAVPLQELVEEAVAQFITPGSVIAAIFVAIAILLALRHRGRPIRLHRYGRPLLPKKR